jgi:hypothetical protein
VKNAVLLYRQKLGQNPVLVTCSDNILSSGIPDLFSGSKSGNLTTLEISGNESEAEVIIFR